MNNILKRHYGSSAKKITFMFLITTLFFNIFLNAKTFATELDVAPEITSEAAILIEEGSGRVLYEKNQDQIMYPASLTKVATAIYAIENGNLDDIVTVSENARNVDGTRVYLEAGEQVPLKKLIQGLLINSGNDAGVAIAEHLHGTVEAFAPHLNDYLKEIGLENTNFVNPHGLFDPNHTTTARDLALLTQYAMKNDTFREIFGTEELKWDGETWDTTLITHHKLLREQPYEGVTGGKNGYVQQSQQTLITTAKRGDLSVIAVVLKGPTQKVIYNDTRALLDYAFANFHMVSIPKGNEYKTKERIYVTKDIFAFPIAQNEEFKEKITSDGLLKIVNQNEEELLVYPTSGLDITEIQTEKEVKAAAVEEKDPLVTLNGFTLVSAITILGIILFLKLRMNRIRARRF
ncbi:D-alanyl-D-alanine carboxypeptidase family protein [Bacillaceae bacterium CLA-AA-H227]|uniref:D-alanyl-D-alanine carboxypeptidase family protein n=1 Tax=Robertmurraya yapensis (ex Hitch et al 2024) TaxID=3133160 RepID=A0ACC6SEE7_9BACI